MTTFLTGYNARLKEFQTIVNERFAINNKNSLISYVLDPKNKGKLNKDQQTNFSNIIRNVTQRKQNCDMDIIVLIRLLYLTAEKSAEFQESVNHIVSEICQTLSKFPFWPALGENQDCFAEFNANKLIFWSENHLFMTLSSAYLFCQYIVLLHERKLGMPVEGAAQHKSLEWEERFLECQLLKQYLALHIHKQFQGIFEINSHGYIHLTFCSLLNLVDFGTRNDQEVSKPAGMILDYITTQIMLGTDPLFGISSLAGKSLLLLLLPCFLSSLFCPAPFPVFVSLPLRSHYCSWSS
jgi:hypothetical protein